MPVKRNCKDCGDPMLAYTTTQNRCGNCLKKRQKPKLRKPLPRQTKPIRQKGKVTLTYEKWRDTVARPYLDRVFGRQCAKCGAPPPVNEETGVELHHDVDHILERGSHPELRMVLSNVRYLCRSCHSKKQKEKL